MPEISVLKSSDYCRLGKIGAPSSSHFNASHTSLKFSSSLELVKWHTRIATEFLTLLGSRMCMIIWLQTWDKCLYCSYIYYKQTCLLSVNFTFVLQKSQFFWGRLVFPYLTEWNSQNLWKIWVNNLDNFEFTILVICHRWQKKMFL